MDDNLTVFKELVSIGDAQEEAMDVAMKNADTLDRIEAKVSEPVEPPVVVVPDTVTVNNFPDTQKVEVINQEEVDLKKVEQLLEKVVKILPDIKDDRPAEQLKKLSEFLFKDNSKKEVIDLLKQILEKEEPVYELPKELITKENRIKVEVDRAGSFSSAGLASETKQDEMIAAINTIGSIGVYTQLIDDAGMLIYIGEAVPGTATSAASWRIKRVDITNDPDVTIAWAGTGFTNIWDNRAALSYS